MIKLWLGMLIRSGALVLLAAARLTLAAAGEPYRAMHERPSALLEGASAKAQERARLIRASMDKVVIPELALSGVPIGEAIKRVSGLVTRHAPADLPSRRGLTITLALRSEAPDAVTVDLRSATLPQVLDAVCAQHGYVWVVEPYAIRVVPQEAGPAKKPDAEPAKPAPPAK